VCLTEILASLLQVAQAMVALNRPTAGEYKSVENFMNNEKPLVKKEGSFIYQKEDLVTLRPGREHAWLDSSVEKFLRLFKCSFIQVSILSTRDSVYGTHLVTCSAVDFPFRCELL